MDADLGDGLSLASAANQLGMVFSKLDCTPRWRERLPEIEVPTLVVHGRSDCSSRSAAARRSRARYPGRGCSCSRKPAAAAGEVARRCSRSDSDGARRAGHGSADTERLGTT
jgi:pimeloyl-ACP methyl ester carboxylesterase